MEPCGTPEDTNREEEEEPFTTIYTLGAVEKVGVKPVEKRRGEIRRCQEIKERQVRNRIKSFAEIKKGTTDRGIGFK